MATQLPVPQIIYGETLTTTLKKIGNFVISFSPALKQPRNDATVAGPRFYGYDQTGAGFSLCGYYRSIPCWKPTSNGMMEFYQYAGFCVIDGYCWDVTSLLSNPFEYTPVLTPYNLAQYQAPQPLNVGMACYSGSVGIGTITFNQNQANLGDQTMPKNVMFETDTVSIPTLVFEDTTFILAVNKINYYANVGSGCQYGGYNLAVRYSTSYLIDIGNAQSEVRGSLTYVGMFCGMSFPAFQVDNYSPCFETGTSYNYPSIAVQYFPPTSNLYGPGGANPYDENNSGSGFSLPFYTANNGKIQALFSTKFPNNNADTADNYQAKVHPGSGNYVKAYSPSQQSSMPLPNYFYYCGNVWCDTIPQNTPNADIVVSTIYAIILEDENDNSLIQLNTPGYSRRDVQQIPGGGFMIMNTWDVQHIIFLISPDLKSYIKVTMQNDPYGIFYNANAETIGMDANGFFYAINNSNQLLWSGPGKPTIDLACPGLGGPLYWAANICRDPSSCNSVWEA